MRKFRPGRLFWRLKRVFQWSIFIYRQKYIDDYAVTLEVFTKILLETAEYFEKTDITQSSLQDAKRMKLCVKLFNLYKDEYYTNQLRINRMDYGFHIPREEYERAQGKEQKCLDLACKIISQDIHGWWQ